MRTPTRTLENKKKTTKTTRLTLSIAKYMGKTLTERVHKLAESRPGAGPIQVSQKSVDMEMEGEFRKK